MKSRLDTAKWIQSATLIVVLLAAFCDASNWAQVSGKISQNIVVPYYPAPNRPHWAARYGMVTITVSMANESAQGILYLLGGDTYDGDTTARSQLPGVLDMKWETGYKNDVWKMTGTEWYQKGDPRLRGPYHQKIPKVESRVKWDSVQQGLRPPRGTTFEEWTKCEPFFRNLNADNDCDNPNLPPPPNTMWSPRRHHAGVYFDGYLWIMGGRAREFIDLPEERSIGGIIGPHVQDITSKLSDQRFSTQREASVVKSDVWRSLDGKKWDLINPGCRSQQSLLIAKGHPSGGKQGTIEYKCEVTSDCYGAEICQDKTCVCNMWSPREQHAVTAYRGFMYVSGGYASRLYNQFSNCGPYACGDTDASAYRYFMADLWQSADGNVWRRLTEGTATSWPGRGGHQMLAIVEANNIPHLWVIGGRGGDQTEMGGPEVYFNDIWRAPIVGDGVGPFERYQLAAAAQGSKPTPRPPHYVWEHDGGMPWLPRTGHTVALETGSDAILGVRTLYLYGGYNNGTFFEDLWALRLDNPKEGWRQDFTPQAYYSTGVGTEFKYHLNSPSSAYVTPDSPLHMLQRYWVPTNPVNVSGTPVERRIYLSQDKVEIMNSVGLHTIRDLAEIDLYTLLKLRGFDYPQVPKSARLKMYDVCDYRALAIALVEKCSLNLPSLFDGQRNMPWNIKPEFGGAPPAENKIKWHGRDNYDFLLPEVDDPVLLTDKWDGCTYNPQIQGLFGPNVDGLGYVDQVLTVRQPKAELQELFCRQTPGKRAYHNMVVFEERLYVIGGKQSEKFFYADAWYRDSKLPKARIKLSPGSRDTFPWFHFVSDKPGSYFEFRVWDPNTFKELREWTPVTHKTDIGWLDWRMGGPGNGRYQLYVRAIDPAGNRDATYLMNYNVYNWYYLSPTPWDIILGTIFGFLFLCFLAYMEYRRRVKKAAMERYAMKRMRRKFKAMQRDINGRAVDWRTLYMESKANEEAGLKDKKKKKKARDKNAEKREKDRKKREKEKELIKKKLAASKDHKDKLRKEEDEEATMDAAPKKLTGGKKSRVAPGSGEGDDDSDLGLDELLIKDENDKAGRPGAVKVKGKPAGKGGKGVAVAGDDNDGLDGGGGDAPVAPLKLKDKGAPKAPASGGTVAIADSSKEVGAGQLKASADTETGTKQRRVNKQLKEYDSGGAGPDAKKNS